MHDLAALLDECHADAQSVIKRHQKHASVALYRVLGKALVICEQAVSQEELRALIKTRSSGALTGRRYAEAGSDVYTVVCRYVFEGSVHGNVSRYACALREAKLRQIRGADLAQWLKDNGGVVELFTARARDTLVISTKCLRLDQAVSCARFSRIHLELEHMPNNVFHVREAGPSHPTTTSEQEDGRNG